jgi:hypothetical protein
MKQNLLRIIRFILTLPVFFLTFASCSGGRVLPEQEKNRLGLQGVVHEVRLCPVKNDRVQGACELVTCEPRAGGFHCVAVPAPER